MNTTGGTLPVEVVKPYVLKTLGWWHQFAQVWYLDDDKEVPRNTTDEIDRYRALLFMCEHSTTGTIDITLGLLNEIMRERGEPGRNKDKR